MGYADDVHLAPDAPVAVVVGPSVAHNAHFLSFYSALSLSALLICQLLNCYLARN